jgi:hypothetical protein
MTSHINATPTETPSGSAVFPVPLGETSEPAAVPQRTAALNPTPHDEAANTTQRLTIVAALSSYADARPADSPYHRLANQTRARIEHFPLRGLDVAPISSRDEFQRFESKNGRFVVRSRAWCLTRDGRPRCDVRMVFIAGSKNNIINTWVFPYDPSRDPVFAAELIAMGGQPRLTFMDIQVPVMPVASHRTVAAAAAGVRSRYGDLRIAEQPPGWAVEATSGQYLFTRQLPASWFGRICHAYLELLECYLDLISSAPSNPQPPHTDPEALATLHEYQVHHMHNSPGEVFLGKVFGKDWTAAFLNEFLFCPPGEIA